MVKSIQIENFKNIEYAKIDFGGFNVVVGPNGSGKTSFLKVLPFLNVLFTESATKISSFLKRGLSSSDFGIVPTIAREIDPRPVKVKIEFEDEESGFQYDYSIELSPEQMNEIRGGYFISSEIFNYKKIGKTGPAQKIFSRTQNDVTFGSKLKNTRGLLNITDHSCVINLLSLVLPGSDKDDSYYKAIQNLLKLSKSEVFYFSHGELKKFDNRMERQFGRRISYDLEHEITGLSETENWELFKDALKQVLNIDDVTLIKLGPVDKSETQDIEDILVLFGLPTGYSQITDLSDGSVLVIAIIARLLGHDQDFFIIEEPETSIHPKALKDLVEFFKSFSDKQFLISSHSIVLLNAVEPNEVITARVGRNGLAKLTKISDDQELIKHLKKGYITFSDHIFFEQEDES